MPLLFALQDAVLDTTAAAADSLAALAPAEPESLTVLELLGKGGWTMIPIAILSILALFLVAERLIDSSLDPLFEIPGGQAVAQQVEFQTGRSRSRDCCRSRSSASIPRSNEKSRRTRAQPAAPRRPRNPGSPLRRFRRFARDREIPAHSGGIRVRG